MTNGFPAQPNFGAPQQFAQQQYAQPPAQQAPQFGGAQQTGAYFNQQPQQGSGQMPPQFQPPAVQFNQQPQPETTDTESYFTGGAAWISWDSDKGYRDGTPRGGQIIAKRMADQTDMDTGEVRMSKFNKNQPLQMLVLTLQTNERTDPDDDGVRQMAVKSGLRAAAKPAFEAVGAKDLEIGGWLYAARMRKEPIPNTKFKRNIFEAVYARPGAPDPMQGRAAYQAPPQPPAQPPMPVPQPSASADQYAAYAAAQAAQQQPQQNFTQAFQPAQPAPPQGPIANMPATAMANFAQAAQHDPNVQAAVYGQPPAQPGFMPGAQLNGAPVPSTPPADPQAQPGQWSPFS